MEGFQISAAMSYSRSDGIGGIDDYGNGDNGFLLSAAISMSISGRIQFVILKPLRLLRFACPLM